MLHVAELCRSDCGSTLVHWPNRAALLLHARQPSEWNGSPGSHRTRFTWARWSHDCCPHSHTNHFTAITANAACCTGSLYKLPYIQQVFSHLAANMGDFFLLFKTLPFWFCSLSLLQNAKVFFGLFFSPVFTFTCHHLKHGDITFVKNHTMLKIMKVLKFLDSFQQTPVC